MRDDNDRTASLMTPAKLAQLKVQPAAAASPAAWLDQLAADAGSGHVRRLLDLSRQLQGQLRDGGHGPLRTACSSLGGALGQVDFSLLEPKGWLARATGKGKEALAAFLAQQEGARRAGEDLADEWRAWQRRQQAQGAATDRTVVEFEVEARSIDKIMDQGARWLQDMRNQLKAREAQGGDAAVLGKIQEDTRRCELLVARLKRLRAVDTVAQNVVQQCRAAAQRRAALAQALQQLVEGDLRQCEGRLAAVADEARANGAATRPVDEARRAQQGLAAALEQAASDCAALQTQERSVLEALDALQEPLQAAA